MGGQVRIDGVGDVKAVPRRMESGDGLRVIFGRYPVAATGKAFTDKRA